MTEIKDYPQYSWTPPKLLVFRLFIYGTIFVMSYLAKYIIFDVFTCSPPKCMSVIIITSDFVYSV